MVSRVDPEPVKEGEQSEIEIDPSLSLVLFI
jgi:hypothetical protein